MKCGTIDERYGVTGHPIFARVPLVSVKQFEIGGWDYRSRSLAEQLTIYRHIDSRIVSALENAELAIYPGLWTEFDYPLGDEETFARRPNSVGDGAAMVAEDIESFRRQTGCGEVILVFVGTPSRDDPTLRAIANQEMPDASGLLPSGFMYALGAADAGAHFVDFTPSRTLELTPLWEYARHRRVQVAGRDGSTGQTMLKVTLAEMFARRGIDIRAWYSTNLIGNRDGLILSKPEYSSAKFGDKTDALRVPRGTFHHVAIEYLPPWGDAKESWDAVECESWLGAPLSVRINWRGQDSALAGAMIVDLARLLHRGATQGRSGFQPELGFFFKRPFLREDSPISERWRELTQSYAE
jgi:myo-inositol-1-phosphate synthase